MIHTGEYTSDVSNWTLDQVVGLKESWGEFKNVVKKLLNDYEFFSHFISAHQQDEIYKLEEKIDIFLQNLSNSI